MLIDSVINLNQQECKLFLCKMDLNKTVISKIWEAKNRIKLNLKFGNVSECSFSIPYMIDVNHEMVENPHISMIKDRYTIKLVWGNLIEYFTIRNSQDSMEDADQKNFTCYSLQYELNDKSIKSYSVTSYNAQEALVGNGSDKIGILNNTLWTTDYIDPDFLTVYRSINIPQASVLNSIFQIANTFSAIVIFNTSTRKISLYKQENVGLNRGSKFSYGHYLKTLNREINSDDICTRLSIYGKNNVSIQSVNPTGTSYIENFSYFQNSDYMSAGLLSALTTYQNLIATKQPITKTAEASTTTTNIKITSHGLVVGDYISNTTRASTVRKVLTVVDANNVTITAITGQTTSDSILLYKDGTFGKLLYQKTDEQTTLTTKQNELSALQTQMNVITDNIDVAQSMNTAYNAGTSYIIGDYVVYSSTPYKCILASTGNLPTNATYWQNLNTTKNAKQAEIDAKASEITVVNGNIATIDGNITTLRNTIAIENTLSIGQLEELNQFVIEKEVYNEYIEDATQLLAWGTTEFTKINIPPINFTIDVVDLFKVLDKSAQIERDKLVLAETITVQYERMGIDITAKIIEINVDFESYDSLSVTIANVQQILTDKEKLLKMLNQAVSTSTTVNLEKLRWDEASTGLSEVEAILQDVWSTAERAINSGVNESITIDRRGITIKDPNDTMKFIRCMHSVIGLTQDGGNSFKTCISPDGVFAERLVGMLVASTNLIISNTSNSFTVNESGVTITGANLTIVGKLPASEMDSTVVSNASNGQTAYSGTTQYRSSGVPSNNPTPSGITITTNSNATINIKLEWSAYTQGINQADMLLLFWRKDGNAPTVDDSCLAFNVNTANPSYYIFEGVNPADTYSFGISAARRTENGLEIGTIQAPTTAPDWRGVVSDTPNYTANINGTVASTVVSNASTALTNANTANAEIANMASDDKISPVEKIALKKDWDAIVAEKSPLDTQATDYGITTEKTTYDNNYNTLNTYLNTTKTVFANMTTTTDLGTGGGVTLRTYFSDYYTAKVNLLNKVADVTKVIADTVSSGTLKYRTAGAPSNSPNPTGMEIITNTNGTINIKPSWDIYTQGANQADLLLLFWKKGTAPLGKPTINDACISFNVNTTAPSYYIFEGVNPADNYTFGIAAGRRTENGLEVGGIASIDNVPATFTRASVAYLQNGTQINSGLPRYENGYFHNLLTDNQASVETDTTGLLGASGATISRDTTEKYSGSASLKVVTANLDGSGFYTTDVLGAIAGKSYIGQVKLKGAGSITLYLRFKDAAGTGLGDSTAKLVTVTGNWQTYTTNAMVAPANTAYVVILVRASGAQLVTYWVDEIGINEGVLQPWILPSLGKGITVEEGTTNLLTANQSNVETNTTGFLGYTTGVVGTPTVTLTRDTSVYYSGTASLKVVTDGTLPNQGFITPVSPRIAVSSNTGYAMQLRIKGTAGVQVKVQGNGAISNYTSTAFTLTGGWDLFTFTFTTSATETGVAFNVYVNGTIATTFYADGLQLEQKSYATSWQIGGTARAAETLTIPTAGVFTKGSATVEMIFIPTSTQAVAGKLGRLFRIYIDGNNYYTFGINENGRVSVEACSGGVLASTLSVSDPVLTPGVTYNLCFRLNGSTMSHWMNGVKGAAGNVAYTEPVGSLPTNLYIGSHHAGTYQANGIYDDLRISSKARTDAEILAGYESNTPLVVDEWTTAKYSFDSVLTELDWQDITSGTPNFTGNINSVAASTITAVATNFNARNDRKSTTPANPTIASDGTAIDHAVNTDGSADISLEWSFTGSGDAYDIDGFLIYNYSSTLSTAYTFGTSPTEEQVWNIPYDKRAFILQGIAANKYYTFGVQAYRRVDNDVNSTGIIKSSIIKPSLAAENPYRPASSVAFAGDVTGTVNGTAASTVATNATNSVQQGTAYNSVVIDTQGLRVIDNSAIERVKIGEYTTGKYGLRIKDKTGNQTILDEDGILQTWQEGKTDNVDNTHPLVLNIYIPSETISIYKSLLRFKLQAFRAYETGASSGGGSTQTSSSGGGSTQTSTTSDEWSQYAIYVPDAVSSADDHNHLGGTGVYGDHNHGIANGTSLAVYGGGYVNFAGTGQAHWHDISDDGGHGHALTSDHTHDVTISSHTHDVSVPNHTHGITYGIYTSTTATGVTVKINSVDRTNALGGGTGFTTDQTSLNIASYLTIGAWNTIELGTTILGRIDATTFIQTKMGV